MNRFEKYVAALTADEVLELHREAARAAQRIYSRRYRQRWEAGVAASRSKVAA